MSEHRLLLIDSSNFFCFLFLIFQSSGFIFVLASQPEKLGERVGPGNPLWDQFVEWRWHFLGKNSRAPCSETILKFHIWLDNLREVRNS